MRHDRLEAPALLPGTFSPPIFSESGRTFGLLSRSVHTPNQSVYHETGQQPVDATPTCQSWGPRRRLMGSPSIRQSVNPSILQSEVINPTAQRRSIHQSVNPSIRQSVNPTNPRRGTRIPIENDLREIFEISTSMTWQPLRPLQKSNFVIEGNTPGIFEKDYFLGQFSTGNRLVLS